MISTNSFNSGIMNIIGKHSYEFYIISRNLNVKCTCVQHATSQANDDCPKCLGTGYKITIRKIKGAAQDTMLPTTFRSDNFLVARNYFMPEQYYMQKDDLVVDKQAVFVVFEYQELMGLEGAIPYRKVSTIRKKFNEKSFFKNFNKIIRGGKN